MTRWHVGYFAIGSAPELGSAEPIGAGPDGRVLWRWPAVDAEGWRIDAAGVPVLAGGKRLSADGSPVAEIEVIEVEP